MKKLFIIALVAFGMLACVGKNQSTGNSKSGDHYEMKEGLLRGKFSVSATKQVQFSQGNLQYQASSNTWRFATNQYNVVGAENANISNSYTGWIDLFGWGTGDTPTKRIDDESDYASFTDWGINPISNGGNKANLWRTMTNDEWVYLLFGRTNAEKLFGLGSVNGVNGIIILPDSWTTPSGLVFCASTVKGLSLNKDGYYSDPAERNHFADNTYTVSEWSTMESAGAVFFPAAGMRGFNEYYTIEDSGGYWSSTLADEGVGCCFLFIDYVIPCLITDGHAIIGYLSSSIRASVRLVQDVE